MSMSKEELQARIEKKEKDIEKINKRIAKWSNGLREQDIEIVKPFGEIDYIYGTPKYQQQVKIYKNYKENTKDIPESDDWNKGPNFYELYSAYRDLGENKNTLNKYIEAIKKIDNFNNMEKIGPIWDFLTDWENKAYNWYLANAEKYFELKKNYKKAWEENKEKYLDRYSLTSNSGYRNAEYYAKKAFNEDYYSNINSLTVDLTHLKGEYENGYGSEYIYTSYTVDKEKLTKILADEKVRKYDDLVNRITKVTGVITDASGLYIGDKNGEINGVVIGEDGKAKVETISAGGYAVQCFHYRVLVHKIK